MTLLIFADGLPPDFCASRSCLTLLAGAEQFARREGCTRIDSHVHIDPVGFYKRCGFAIAEDVTPGAATVLMIKRLGDIR